MVRLLSHLTVLAFLLANSHLVFGQSEKVFKTKYATIYYAEDKDVNDFIWRIGGKKFEFSSDYSFAQNRVDRIIERVETILDMWPKNLNINIYLQRGDLEPNKIAFYDSRVKAIYVSVDNASDGVFAHEVAHAIINRYFSSPPSSKTQEILTQYVDKYLWSDY